MSIAKIIDNRYPTYLEMNHCINGGTTMLVREDKNIRMCNTERAIKITISISNEDYPKDEVKEGLREIFEKALGYYD